LERSDADLVRAACDGDVDSFRRLYERYYGLAVGVARSRLWDRHLADDAAQEAFAVACRTLHTLRNADRFPEWLGTICRRTAGKMVRWQVNGKSIKGEPAGQAIGEEPIAVAVRDALEQLPVSAREVLQLHYFSGLSYEEIAQSLGISLQAVHGRMQRARRMLARHLAEDR
jgi:RNA polymerase sigma-70 factor (ECF subfamily)